MAAQPLTQSCKGSRGGVGLSFCRGAFGIEGMVEKKMASTSFGGAAGHGEWALGAGSASERTPGAWVVQPLRGADRSATWCMGGPALARGKPERHLALGRL